MAHFVDPPGRISIIEAQRLTGVPGPELMRAIVRGEFSWVEGASHVFMVDLAEVEAWAASRQQAS
jgi:hypothetical protein